MLRFLGPLYGLRLQLTQHSQAGLLAVCTQDIVQPYLAFTQPVPVRSSSHILSCSRRGVLDWAPVSPYISNINVQMQLGTGQRRIIPPSIKGEANDIYNVQRRSTPHETVIGNKLAPDSAAAYLALCEQAQHQHRLAEERGEKWFHDNAHEAATFIRKLVGDAQERLWIVDPYFATVELYRFALAVTTEGVKTTILTGTERLREDERIVPGTTMLPGEILLHEINRLPPGDNVMVLVMTGSQPIIHDRFLIVDNDVWFSGNSLHSLGTRASMIVRLIDPTPIISALEGIMQRPDRVVTLQHWVEGRRDAQSSMQAPPAAAPSSNLTEQQDVGS